MSLVAPLTDRQLVGQWGDKPMALLPNSSGQSVTGRNHVFTVPRNGAANPAQLLHNLNRGPNLRGVTHADHDSRLPPDWKLSFGRVSAQAYAGETASLTALTATAWNEFESAGANLLMSSRRARILPYILKGVGGGLAAREMYVNAPAPFSVRRLDIVVTEHGPAVCENDEMPGGLVHAYWLDRAYGINQNRWRAALNWLTNRGALVFAVSSDYSAPYVQEITWFVGHLQRQGYPVRMVTSKDASRLKSNSRGVTIDGEKVGTVWRLFPVFEAQGPFAPLVDAARHGRLRLVPEVASWGNKAWMGLFWREQEFFRGNMSPASFQLLRKVLPYTAVIAGPSDFPQRIRDGAEWVHVGSYDELKALPTRHRKQLVVKTSGAHAKAARSHGVLIGTSATGVKWSQALDYLMGLKAPLVIQQYLPPAKSTLPVWSVLGGKPVREDFPAKVLVRPWTINGQLVSATAFLTAANSTKLHGTTTGAEVPLSFG